MILFPGSVLTGRRSGWSCPIKEAMIVLWFLQGWSFGWQPGRLVSVSFLFCQVPDTVSQCRGEAPGGQRRKDEIGMGGWWCCVYGVKSDNRR